MRNRVGRPRSGDLRTRAHPPVLRHVAFLGLAAMLGIGLFQWGEAEGRRGRNDRRHTPIVDAVHHAAPAVVSIAARSRAGRYTTIEGAGAGVIVHPAGYVITNSHVIDGAQQIFVEMWQGNGNVRADVVVNQPSQDLALLKLRAPRGRRYPYVSCCGGEDVMLGEPAIAIGNPRGLGDTITVGVVSAMGRDAKMTNGVSLRGLIQTDASINTGNSGGALLNLDGELMGVIVSLMPQTTGIAFAIPANRVCPLLTKVAGRPPRNELAPAPMPTTQAAGSPASCAHTHRSAAGDEQRWRHVEHGRGRARSERSELPASPGGPGHHHP